MESDAEYLRGELPYAVITVDGRGIMVDYYGYNENFVRVGSKYRGQMMDIDLTIDQVLDVVNDGIAGQIEGWEALASSHSGK